MNKTPRVFLVRPVIYTCLIFISFSLLAPHNALRNGNLSSRAQDLTGGEPQGRSPAAVRFSENFDGVTAPALPAGWSTTRTGSNTMFATTATTPETAPNAIFTNSPATAGSAEITSPAVTLGNTRARLIFRHAYATEFRRGYDGGVLEISINGAAFQDILASGATFYAGGYIQTINSNVVGNPLIGRMAWTGDSSGYATSIVDFPLSLANQSVRLRWRYATDSTYEGVGWRIDSVRVEDLAPTVVRYREEFDGASAPNLPTGWTAEPSSIVRGFRTHTELSYTAPNSVFAPATTPGGVAALISPNIRIGSNQPKLIFQHHYATEEGFEGGVLEISINNGPFQDILAAGGSFVHGGYRAPLGDFGNPLEGRQAWTGSTLGFIITEVNLPPGSYRQNVRFKWLFGTDDFIPSIGWWIDTVQVIDQLSGENLSGISIPAGGAAQPYPSEIEVTNHEGLITSVQVNLTNFSHNSPDDVDLMLVAPGGRKVVLMSDVGGSNPVNNLSLSFEDAAVAALPDNAPLVSGNYKPTNFEAADAFPAPAPAGAPTGNTLGVLNGTDANGTWKLFLVDDSGNNAGSINGGWSLDVQTSPNAIAIPTSGAAQPYPAEYIVSGLSGAISKVTVHLTNLSHTAPDDLDLMLVAPNGRRVVLMSDVGGATEIGSLNLTLDDDAGSGLPDNGPLAAGVYKPTDFEAGDDFPAPAPQGASPGTTLATFFGGSPNGVWKLYVVDDTGENFGSLAGSFSLTIQSSPGVCTFNLSHNAQAFPLTGGTGSFNISIAGGCPWEVNAQSDFITITSSATGEGTGTVSYSVAQNFEGGRSGRINITGGSMSRTFIVQQASGCPFAVAQSSLSFNASGGTGVVPVTAGETCGWIGSSSSLWIQINSSTQIGNGNLTFTVQPNTTQAPRSGTVMVGTHQITINQAGPSAKRFDFDGDGRADISVFRPATGAWYVQTSQSNAMLAHQFGLSSDKLAPADFDGDRRTDIAVFRDGNWYLLKSSNNSFHAVQFGAGGDVPRPADFDGDSLADICVFRPSNGFWYWLKSMNNQFAATQFGAGGDVPLMADFDGDAKSEFAVFRPSNNTWYWLQSSNGEFRAMQFGAAGDIAAQEDFDGDGRTDVSVFRPSTGVWYRLMSGAGQLSALQFGAGGDVPVAGDYDGDGRADLSVFRASNGTWYRLNSADGTFFAMQFGLGSDVPVPSAYLP